MLEHELLLFVGIFFLVGAVDEMAVDFAWIWLRLTGQGKTPVVERSRVSSEPLAGPAAILIPAWQEEEVIADTIRHLLAAWPQEQLRLYVGCYRNDRPSAEAIIAGIGGDSRARMIVHDRGIMEQTHQGRDQCIGSRWRLPSYAVRGGVRP